MMEWLAKPLIIIGLMLAFIVAIKLLVFVVFIVVIGITLVVDRYRGKQSQWLVDLLERIANH